jgi:hypothetical protein
LFSCVPYINKHVCAFFVQNWIKKRSNFDILRDVKFFFFRGHKKKTFLH